MGFIEILLRAIQLLYGAIGIRILLAVKMRINALRVDARINLVTHRSCLQRLPVHAQLGSHLLLLQGFCAKSPIGILAERLVSKLLRDELRPAGVTLRIQLVQTELQA